MSAPFILYVEDDQNDVTLLRFALQSRSIPASIIPVGKPAEFANAIAYLEPELILADGNVPGFDTAAALAMAREQCPLVPFYYISGSVSEEKAAALIASGAAGFLSKNDADAVSGAIRRVLHERPQRYEAGEPQGN